MGARERLHVARFSGGFEPGQCFCLTTRRAETLLKATAPGLPHTNDSQMLTTNSTHTCGRTGRSEDNSARAMGVRIQCIRRSINQAPAHKPFLRGFSGALRRSP